MQDSQQTSIMRIPNGPTALIIEDIENEEEKDGFISGPLISPNAGLTKWSSDLPGNFASMIAKDDDSDVLIR